MSLSSHFFLTQSVETDTKSPTHLWTHNKSGRRTWHDKENLWFMNRENMGVSACWLGYLAQKSCVHFAKCLPSNGFTEWVTTILFSYSYACVASLLSMMHRITAFDFYCWPCPYNLLGSSGISRLTGKEKLNMLALNKWLVLYTDKLGSLESQSESFFFFPQMLVSWFFLYDFDEPSFTLNMLCFPS